MKTSSRREPARQRRALQGPDGRWEFALQIAVSLIAKARGGTAGLLDPKLDQIVTPRSLERWEEDLEQFGATIKAEQLGITSDPPVEYPAPGWGRVFLQPQVPGLAGEPFGYGVFLQFDDADDVGWHVHWVGDPDTPLDAIPESGGFAG